MVNAVTIGSFQQERFYLGQELGRLELTDANGKIGAIRVIKVAPGSILERLLQIACIQAVVIRILFGHFAYAHGYLVSKRSFDGSILQRKVIRQLDSSLLTSTNQKTRASLIQVKAHLEKDKLAFRTLVQKTDSIFKGARTPSCPEFFIHREQGEPELLVATKWLGGGSFKRVVKAYNAKTAEKRAVAILEAETFFTRGMAESEYATYQVLKRENVSSIVGCDLLKSSQTKEKIGIMRYCKGLDFYQHLQQLPHEKKIALYAKMANTIAQIHALGYVHRDIKPNNFFVDKDEVLLGDFGLATRQGKIAVAAGSPDYFPPDLYHIYKIIWPVRTTQDAWAFGTLLHFTFSQQDIRVDRVKEALLQTNPEKRITLAEAQRLLST